MSIDRKRMRRVGRLKKHEAPKLLDPREMYEMISGVRPMMVRTQEEPQIKFDSPVSLRTDRA